ncbi:MAG: OsmC family protein [Gemmatimonadota bacterium]|nr:OsmC family protein [Gemmatimonadota bacterium]
MPSERAVRLTWSGTGMRFQGQGTEPPSPPIVVDGDGAGGPSPMQVLLLATAGCAGSDVVAILAKMRVTLHHLVVNVMGVRRDEEPRRFTEVRFHFALEGDGLDRAKAERAVGLSLEKYCSVVHSLAPDIAIRHEILLG